MAVQLRCLETNRTARRDWIDGQMVGEVEYRDVCAELGGEPTGDVVLCEVTREGSEATTPRQMEGSRRLSHPGNSDSGGRPRTRRGPVTTVVVPEGSGSGLMSTRRRSNGSERAQSAG